MLEREVEQYLKWAVERKGGKSYKFTSPSHKGVADRIVCFADGTVWFVEVKTTGGRLSELQRQFAEDMKRLNQNYVCLWSKEDIDKWLL